MRFKYIILLLLLFSCTKEQHDRYLGTNSVALFTEKEKLSLVSFNIQVLGESKSRKDVMPIIIDIIDDFDLIAIQEIRDASSFTLENLRFMMPLNYKLEASSRDGRSISKEQAIFLYNDKILDVVWSRDFDDVNDDFERSPFITKFKLDDSDYNFIVVNVHLKPTSVVSEIKALSSLIYELYTTEDTEVIVLGDFNSDGLYFKEEELNFYFPEEMFQSTIKNEWDTTVALSNNTYDRIILTNEIKYIDSGVIYYNVPEGIELKNVSDHYPVYTILEY